MPDDAAQLAVGHLARPIKPVSPDDPAGKAVARLRQSPVGAVPIAQGFQLVGLLTEADLAPLLSQGPESWRKLRVSDLAQRQAVAVPSDMPLAGALHAFEESGQPVLLVADGPNSCRGLITRSDVLTAASGELVPPHIGGMATPLGVHLTTGTVRAGASDLGLFLTGAMLMSFNYVAGAILALVALVVQFFAGPASPIYAFIAGIGLVPNAERWPAYADYTLLVAGVQFVLFLELMRISPLSGYHAAEHQTVHAMEQGEELTPEAVAQFPRAHPRCGTNLIALVVLAAVFLPAISRAGEWGQTVAVLAALVILLSWRRLGPRLQWLFTTKRASAKQLASGIAAGKALLVAHRQALGKPVSDGRRMWNLGFVQVMAGFISVMLLANLWQWLGGPPLPGMF